MDSLKKVTLQLSGMHCASCEVLIERTLIKIDGIERDQVNHASGKAVLHCSADPAITSLQSAIAPHGYHLTHYNGQGLVQAPVTQRNTKKEYLQIGGIVLLVMAGYVLVRQFNLIPGGFGVSENMSYGIVLGMGLLASISTCMAVTGGLLLAVSAKHAERHPDQTPAQKLRPLLHFNLGRLIGYAGFGALIGAIGSALTLSPQLNGIITIVASLAMIVLGLQLLHIFPSARRLQLRLPKFISHKIHDLSESRSPLAPLSLGAFTFFLPCGFTQALQLYVLSQGGALRGALVMGMFALGTLPALLSVSALSSYLRGRSLSYLLKFAGVVALISRAGTSNGLRKRCGLLLSK